MAPGSDGEHHSARGDSRPAAYRHAFLGVTLVGAIALAGCGGSEPSEPSPLSSPTLPRDGSLAGELDAIRARHAMPSLAAFAMSRGRIVEEAAVGQRAVGHPEGVTADDQWHLGSITKSMTATLCAEYVEDGWISWTTTVSDVFPDLVPGMREEYRSVRLEELLSHTAGVVADIGRAPSWSGLSSSSLPLPVQRRRLVAELLALPPEVERGTYSYSNGGFVIAGAMLEEITGEVWENLITARLFAPLGMTSTGFGPPGTVGAAAPDQPWGHVTRGSTLVPLAPGPSADNPAAIGPAGTVHSTFADLARYFAFHLDGARGTPTSLLTTESMQKLHQPMPGTDYALGWNVGTRDWAGSAGGSGPVLFHQGSNSYWWAAVWLAPERDLALFAATNAGGDPAFAAADEAVVALIRRQ